MMLGHYGWIMALQDIDHPEADRHGGRIYLRATDLRPGASPKEGDEVTFFLYADENGLGAEDCYATNDPRPPQPPAPVKKQVYSRPQITRRAPPQNVGSRKTMNAAAQEFVPTVLVPVNVEEPKPPVGLNPEAKDFVPAPPGLAPTLNAEASEFVPSFSLASRTGRDMYCAINTKRFYDDDDSSDDGTESTASDLSGRVLVAPGLSTCFVSKEGKPEQWSNLSARCAQAVLDADMDSDSWCDDESDDESFAPNENRAEEWAAVSARCAQAVGKIEHNDHPWHMRNAAAAAKMKADVGNDIRWEVVLDALAEMDGTPVSVADDATPSIAPRLPPGLAPPGLEPALAPPGLA